jgi:acylphosphatase
MKRVHLIVVGQVQGVFFRASASQVARSLQLSGFVRNLSNGNVEIAGEGEEEALKRLIDWCRKGPPGAYVERLNVAWKEASNQFTGFEVRY